MPEQSTDRVMIFIDGGYLDEGIRNKFGPTRRIDLRALGIKLVGKRRLMRMYYYTGRIERPPNDHWKGRMEGQQRYEAALAHVPYLEIKHGRLQFDTNNRPRQKGVDVLLSLDMLRFAIKRSYETAILLSGDGDFADVVQMVKDEGARVETVTFPGTRSYALLQAADICTEVDESLLDGCWRTALKIDRD